MDMINTDAVIKNDQAKTENNTKRKFKINFKAWAKKFFVKKNIISLIVIFILLLGLTQVAVNFGYQMGMVDSFKKQTQLNFWLSQNVLGFSNKKSESDWYVFWDVWSKLKNEYVERDLLTDEALVENAIRGIVATTEDQFSEFLTYQDYEDLNGELAGSFEGIGAEIGKRNGQVVIIAPLKNSPAAKIGLRAGDMIIEVDGKSTIDFSTTDVVKLIRGKKGTKVNVTVYRESIADKKTFEIVRDQINIPSCDVEFTNDNVAVLRIYNFYDNLLSEFATSLATIKQKNPRGIIIDLRNNPGGYLDAYLEMAGHFFNKGEVVLIEDFNGKQENVTEISKGDGFLKNKKIVVLINGGTASAAEILAGALRDNNNVKIIGEQSFGKGSVQELMPLRNNNFLKLTIAYWLTPKGTNISKKGITPDIEVKVPEELIDAMGSYEGIDLAKDIQLKKAMEELNKIIK